MFLAIGSVFSVLLLAEIIHRYFKKTEFRLVVLMIGFVLFNNKILWVMSRPWVYEFVTSAGYCFVMIGMTLFMRYLRTSKKAYLFGASTSMALAVGCRPPTLYISIIIFMKLLYDFYLMFKEKKNKEIIKTIIIAVIPYVIVGISLMIYNYIRFHSIFEFGANYQISVTDFRYLGISINRIAIALLTYLVAPIKHIWEFPFVISEDWMPQYNGFYYSQAIGGGYFTMSIIGIIVLLFPWLRKSIKKYNKEMSWLITINLILGLFIMIFEGNKAGSLGRYMIDFVWLWNIVTVLMILFIYNTIKNAAHKKIFLGILFVIIIYSCIVNLLVLYSNENSLLIQNNNIKLYYMIKYMISFWK